MPPRSDRTDAFTASIESGALSLSLQGGGREGGAEEDQKRFELDVVA